MVQRCRLESRADLSGAKTNDASAEALTVHSLDSATTANGAGAHHPNVQMVWSLWSETARRIPKGSLRMKDRNALLVHMDEQLLSRELIPWIHQLQCSRQLTDHGRRGQTLMTQQL